MVNTPGIASLLHLTGKIQRQVTRTSNERRASVRGHGITRWPRSERWGTDHQPLLKQAPVSSLLRRPPATVRPGLYPVAGRNFVMSTHTAMIILGLAGAPKGI